MFLLFQSFLRLHPVEDGLMMAYLCIAPLRLISLNPGSDTRASSDSVTVA